MSPRTLPLAGALAELAALAAVVVLADRMAPVAAGADPPPAGPRDAAAADRTLDWTASGTGSCCGTGGP